ncbi:MAG: tetratricopeptide repeat protein [Flavobacteriales bacterium]
MNALRPASPWTFLLLLGMIGAFIGCGNRTVLSDLPVYDEAFQRTYFEGQNHLAKGDLDLAYSSFNACLELEPAEIALHFDLAKIDLQRSDFESALLHLNEVIENNESHRWAHEFRAEAALNLGYSKMCHEDLVWILNHRPGDIEWTFDWTMKLADFEDYEGALVLCDTFDKLTPGDPDILLQRLYLFELLGEYEAIYYALENAVVEFPDVVEFKLQWAQMLQITEQSEAALDILSQIVREDPTNGRAQLDLAHLYTGLNQIGKAQNALIMAFESEDVLLEEKHEILVQYLQIAQVDTSLDSMIIRLLDAAIGQHPRSAILQLLAADFEQTRGNPEAAIDHALIAVDLAPGNPMGWINLIALDAELVRFEEMQVHALQAFELFPLDAEFGYYAGLAALNVGDHNAATETLQRGLAVVFDNPDLEAGIQGLLGDALHAKNQLEEAFQAYEKSLELVPDNPVILNNYAYYLAESNQHLERALECSERLMQLVPNDANFMDTHAWVLFKNDRFPEALDFITQALFASEAQGPTFWEHDGDIRWAMGDQTGALKSWKKALESGGDSERIQAKIDEHS